MDTLITIAVVGPPSHAIAERVDQALGWFGRVEAACSRFDPHSELSGLTRRPGEAVTVSPLLFEAIRFALAVARASGGAFDPTVGHRLEALGFNRNYRTGARVDSGIAAGAPVSYRDVRLDPDRHTITLRRPLVLDLAAVVKGMAIDLAVQALRPLVSFAIDAGGDLFLHGRNSEGELWRVGIAHPRRPAALLETLRLSERAVCTSGDYQRRSAAGESHLLDPRATGSPSAVASVTVIAPTAMVADALSTAAFVLGPARGVRFLERQGAEGLIVTPALERVETAGFGRYRQ